MERKPDRGFTLAELLIVVAIISVLVVISIPIFHNQLKKARLATNQANARSAVSASVQYYYESDDDEMDQVRNVTGMNGRIYLLYDCKTGKITDLGYSRQDPYDNKYKHKGSVMFSQQLIDNNHHYPERHKQISEWTINDTLGQGSTFLSDRVYPFWICYIEADGSCSAIIVYWN
jgi:prepilin-type N-terminal cleavage/methylation domain-containing protein